MKRSGPMIEDIKEIVYSRVWRLWCPHEPIEFCQSGEKQSSLALRLRCRIAFQALARGWKNQHSRTQRWSERELWLGRRQGLWQCRCKLLRRPSLWNGNVGDNQTVSAVEVDLFQRRLKVGDALRVQLVSRWRTSLRLDDSWQDQ